MAYLGTALSDAALVRDNAEMAAACLAGLSDADRRLASPLTTYTRRNPEQDARFLKKIIEDEEIAHSPGAPSISRVSGSRTASHRGITALVGAGRMVMRARPATICIHVASPAFLSAP